ncbi:MAG: DUF952 domain-containing protein [Rhizobiaceae bacterium]|nr:DUF952 domain-containing protein [Rhizobiaceae bacterium]
MAEIVYKICSEQLWQEAKRQGHFDGAAIDLADGFIHFSTASQVRETAAKHFSGQHDLVLVAVPAKQLGPALKWEVSRGGALFPHLYASLDLSVVLWTRPLPLDDHDTHIFPADLP